MLYKNKLLKTAYNSINDQNLQDVIQYFNTISGKVLKLSFIRQNLFKTKWEGSQISIISRCHLQAAIIYIKHLMTSKDLSEIHEEIKMIIAEIVPFVKILDIDQDTSFIMISTNDPPSFAHHRNAIELFYNHNIRIDYRNNYSCDILVLYALRLTLEKRIYGIIGVDYIRKKDNKPISLSIMIKLIQRLKSIEFSSSIKWEELEAVNKWLNHYMHRSLRPHPWTIHQGIETINEIVKIKSYKNDKGGMRSWYGTTVVKNIIEFEKEREDTIRKEFPDCKISWLNSPELLIINGQ